MANFNRLMTRGAVLTDDFATSAQYEVGGIVQDENGNVYEYCMTADNETWAVGDCIILLTAGAEAIDTTNDAAGGRCGICVKAVTGVASTAKYGFVLTKTGIGQVTSLNTATSCAAAIGLQTTSTAGRLDDAETVSVYGIVLGTATGGAAAVNTTAIVNYPYVALIPAHSHG